MIRDEAIALLSACRRLAFRLKTQTTGFELTEEDREALIGFNKVYNTNWLDDPAIRGQAGLSGCDITRLNSVASALSQYIQYI